MKKKPLTIDQLRTLAMSFPETTEEPHFEKTSFRVKKKIFATFDKNKNTLTIKLSEADQGVFLSDAYIYPVPNKWGKQGWTIVELNQVHPDLLKDVVITAYCEVAPKQLADVVRLQ